MLLKFREGDLNLNSHAVKRAVMGEVRKFMLNTLADDLQLLEVVGGGAYQFRVRFIKAFPRGMVDETIANHVFAFLSAKVVEKFGDLSAKQALDAMEVSVQGPPTEEEIAKSWEITSHSTEEARRAFNLPTGDTRGIDHDE